MDPFNFNNDISNTFDEDISNHMDNKLIIYTEKRGRKTNTFLAGWDISKDELKQHLKNLKVKHGCNGSIKKTTISGVEYDNVLHLQGHQTENVQVYLKQLDITNIEVKGC